MSEITFTWNPKKAKRNLRDHGISFEEAKQVFADQFYIVLNDCDVDGEVRLHVIGRVQSQTLVVAAFIDETVDDSRFHFHIISARKAEAIEESTMPNNSNKTKPATKPLFKVTPEMRGLYEKRNRALDSDPDTRVLPPEKWAKAMSRVDFEEYLKRTHATPKKQTTVRLDADVVEWLKSKGEGHISRVNSILRAVMLADLKR